MATVSASWKTRGVPMNTRPTGCLESCLFDVFYELEDNGPSWRTLPTSRYPGRLTISIQRGTISKAIMGPWTEVGGKLFGIVPRVSKGKLELDFNLNKPPWFLYLVCLWYRFPMINTNEARTLLCNLKKYRNPYIAIASVFGNRAPAKNIEVDKNIFPMSMYETRDFFSWEDVDAIARQAGTDIACAVSLKYMLDNKAVRISKAKWWDELDGSSFGLWNELMDVNRELFGHHTYAFADDEFLGSLTARRFFSDSPTKTTIRSVLKRKDITVISER